MQARTYIFWLLLTVPINSYTFQQPCPDIFAELAKRGIKDRYHVGHPVSSSTRSELAFLNLTDETTVFRLGKGAAATVYRIVPKQGPTYLIKKYHDDFEIGDNEEAKAMAADNKVMEHLRNVRVDDPNGILEIAAISKKYPENHATQYEDVRGFSLRTVCQALPEKENEKRQILANEFNRRLDALIVALKQNGTIREARKQAKQEEQGFDWYHVEWAWNKPGVESDFGSVDSIIYDPTTSRLVLVDSE